MTAAGRMLVRAVAAVAWTLLVVAVLIVTLVSDITWVRFVGIFMGLMIVDRIMHRGQGDVPIPILLRRPRINLSKEHCRRRWYCTHPGARL